MGPIHPIDIEASHLPFPHHARANSLSWTVSIRLGELIPAFGYPGHLQPGYRLRSLRQQQVAKARCRRQSQSRYWSLQEFLPDPAELLQRLEPSGQSRRIGWVGNVRGLERPV